MLTTDGWWWEEKARRSEGGPQQHPTTPLVPTPSLPSTSNNTAPAQPPRLRWPPYTFNLILIFLRSEVHSRLGARLLFEILFWIFQLLLSPFKYEVPNIFARCLPPLILLRIRFQGPFYRKPLLPLGSSPSTKLPPPPSDPPITATWRASPPRFSRVCYSAKKNVVPLLSPRPLSM